jgi:type II secretory pathway pseudopilin PulG
MWFDGAEYLVGPQFFGRRAVVQSSALFLRIGAREVARTVIIARKFRIPALRAVGAERARSAGLSLIENIIAIGLFSMVVVGAVYPTLAVMANGDRIARTQSDAVRLAANALNDEEIASAYGAVNEGTVRTQNGALTVVVTVAPSKTGVADAHDIDVAVQDAGGRTLAHAISTVGPAVPAPPPPGHTPNPSPAPSG